MILIPFLAGTILFIIALRSLRRARDSFFWPYTNGSVISAKVRIQESGAGKTAGDKTFSPEIKYCYLVKGEEYICSRIQIMNDYSSPTNCSGISMNMIRDIHIARSIPLVILNIIY